MTIGDLLVRNANKYPDKRAVVSEGFSETFRTLNERVNGLANALLGMGLQKGDRIGVVVHNCHQYIEIYFAAAKTGGVFCPYNNHVKQRELKDVILYSTPKFLFVDNDFADMITGVAPDFGCVKHHISLQKPTAAGVEEYEQLIAQAKKDEPGVKIDEEDLLSIFFTAGTTGNPKGAMRTHGSHVRRNHLRYRPPGGVRRERPHQLPHVPHRLRGQYSPPLIHAQHVLHTPRG